jgi:hypothetical protein
MKAVVQMDCKVKHGTEITRQTVSLFGPKAVGKTMKKLLHESLPRILEKQNQNNHPTLLLKY